MWLATLDEEDGVRWGEGRGGDTGETGREMWGSDREKEGERKGKGGDGEVGMTTVCFVPIYPG